MASTVFPAASAAGKTMYRTMLTSGTSYTVPTGATYLNVSLFGGGGNGSTGSYTGVPATGGAVAHTTLSSTPGASIAYSIGAGGGGTTTFTGATSAAGGGGGGGGAFYGVPGAAQGWANNQGVGGCLNSSNGGGGDGWIAIEYWA